MAIVSPKGYVFLIYIKQHNTMLQLLSVSVAVAVAVAVVGKLSDGGGLRIPPPSPSFPKGGSSASSVVR